MIIATSQKGTPIRALNKLRQPSQGEIHAALAIWINSQRQKIAANNFKLGRTIGSNFCCC